MAKYLSVEIFLAPTIFALKIGNISIDFLGLEDFRKKLK